MFRNVQYIANPSPFDVVVVFFYSDVVRYVLTKVIFFIPIDADAIRIVVVGCFVAHVDGETGERGWLERKQIVMGAS
jgi:hypothetical protein